MLITITGPTGSGKSTLAQELLAQGVTLVPTWTTRPLRPEEEGRGDIVQVHREEMAAQDMLETAEYDHHLYGTPLTPDVVAALQGRCDALKIVEPVGLAALRENVARWAGASTPRLAHVYVDIAAETARERLLARCAHQPTSADHRRLERVARECQEWPKACDWTLVVDNNAPAPSLAGQAQEVMRTMRTHISEQLAANAEDEALLAAEDLKREAGLLFRLLSRRADAAIQQAVAQGQEALEHGNLALVRESVWQLESILQSWELHPAMASQVQVTARAAGAGQPASPGQGQALAGGPSETRVERPARRFGAGPGL